MRIWKLNPEKIIVYKGRGFSSYGFGSSLSVPSYESPCPSPGMLTSMPKPTVELQAKHSVTFILDNLRTSASKRWHVIIPVEPVNPYAFEHLTSWVAFIQHMFFEHATWRVLEASHGFILNHTVAALPRHGSFEEKQNKQKRIFKIPCIKKNRTSTYTYKF